jgi:fucose 4-O-acetylase-like acetyltransferase
MDKSKHVEHIDILKGIAILLVVMGHVIQANIGVNNTLFNIIYSFHMPLFMALSGYVGYITIDASKLSLLWDGVKKKTRTLFIPFISWYLINYIQNYENMSLYDYMGRLVRHVDYGLWFLYVLYIIYIIVYLSSFIMTKFSVKNIYLQIFINLSTVALLLIMSLLFKENILGVKMVAWYLLFFYIGYYISKYKKIEQILSFSSNLSFSAALLLFIIFFNFFNPFECNIIIRFLIAVCGIIIAYSFVLNSRINFYIKKELCYIGVNTLSIYILSAHLLKLEFANLANLNIFPLFIFILFVSVIISYFSIFAARFLSTSKLLSFLLFGKK